MLRHSMSHLIALSAALALGLGSAHAADSGSSYQPPATPAPQAPAPAAKVDLGQARQYIAAEDWTAAIGELKRLNAVRSADWNNLLGYAYRKSARPDLSSSEYYYNQALRIDPQHIGALEYSGELYLMEGKLDLANQRLLALGQACDHRCEEYRTLYYAVEDYRKSGQAGQY